MGLQRDTSGKLLNNTLVEKARVEEISVIRELGMWEVVDRPCDEDVFGTRWVDINNGDETKPFYRSRADLSFFTATPPLEALRSLLISQRSGTANGVDRTCCLDADRRAPSSLLQRSLERSVRGTPCRGRCW